MRISAGRVIPEVLKGRLFRRLFKRGGFRRGQGMVEFALVLPVLILLLIGILEFGYFFFIYATANTAAREAVRYGAGSGIQAERGLPFYQDCEGIREVAFRIGKFAGIKTESDVKVFLDDGVNTTTGQPVNRVEVCKGSPYDAKLEQRIAVKISAKYSPIIKLLRIPDIVIQAESARTIVKRVQLGGQ